LAQRRRLARRRARTRRALTTILRTIESGEASSAIIGHFDSEPIMLYPELEERGWTHEAMDAQCGDCEGGFMVRRG
jgi:hypothetical protein